MFVLHKDRLREALADEENDTAVTAFDPKRVDADELHRFVEEALNHDVISSDDSTSRILIYPSALEAPDPIVTVETSRATVLGNSVNRKIAADEADSAEGTILTARSIVDEANALYLATTKDQRALDQLARTLNSYADEEREWDQVEICNELVMVLRGTGRTVKLVDD